MKCAAVFFVSLVALCCATLPYGIVPTETTVGLPYRNPIVDKYISKYYPVEGYFPKHIVGGEYYKPYLNDYLYLLGLKQQVPEQYYRSMYDYPKGVIDSYKPYYYKGYYDTKFVSHLNPYIHPYEMKYQNVIPELRHFYPETETKYTYPVPEVKYPIVPVPEVPTFWRKYMSPTSLDYKETVYTGVPTGYPLTPYMNQYVTPYQKMLGITWPYVY